MFFAVNGRSGAADGADICARPTRCWPSMSPPAYSTPSSWGVLAYLGMLVLKVKYAPAARGVVRAEATPSPSWVPFLGGIPRCWSPPLTARSEALYLSIYIVMQQIDAWFIDPMITSNRLQISPLWGAAGGDGGRRVLRRVGHVLGAPAFAVALLTMRRFVQRRDRQQAQDERQLAQLGRDGEPPHRKRHKRHPQRCARPGR